MKPYQHDFIQLALEYQALRFGEFTLKSGRQSPYFFNVGHLNDGNGLMQLGECYAQSIIASAMPFEMLYGPAYKGIPLVVTTAIALARLGKSVPYCFNRKEAKDHGEGGIFVGAPLKGRVLILDDVITAGTAMRESFALIEQTNATVSGIMVALDRQERGQQDKSAIEEIKQQYQIPVTAIISLEHIMQYVGTNKDFHSFAKPLSDYQQQYGTR